MKEAVSLRVGCHTHTQRSTQPSLTRLSGWRVRAVHVSAVPTLLCRDERGRVYLAQCGCVLCGSCAVLVRWGRFSVVVRGYVAMAGSGGFSSSSSSTVYVCAFIQPQSQAAAVSGCLSLMAASRTLEFDQPTACLAGSTAPQLAAYNILTAAAAAIEPLLLPVLSSRGHNSHSRSLRRDGGTGASRLAPSPHVLSTYWS